MKKHLIKQVDQLEKMSGIKERFVCIFNKDYYEDTDTEYYFELDENGKQIFYKDGKVIPLEEIEKRFIDVICINVDFGN